MFLGKGVELVATCCVPFLEALVIILSPMRTLFLLAVPAACPALCLTT
jgi:hypothetical protein